MAPDLNLPDFFSLTVGRMVRAAHDTAALLPQDRPVIAVGSSLGGVAATLFAAERAITGKPLDALVLIAPAFELASLWHKRLGKARLEQWHKTGELELKDEQGRYVYGPAFPKLGFDFYADAMRRETQLAQRPPGAKTIIFHGEDDLEVPVEVSRRYCTTHAGVELVSYPAAGHALQTSLDDITERTNAFL